MKTFGFVNRPIPRTRGLIVAHIVLVATVHRDARGYDRLLSVLHEEEPDCLTLEISPYAAKIRALLDSSRCRKLVHVGGWKHLLDDGNHGTLFGLLSDLHPQRRLLPA